MTDREEYEGRPAEDEGPREGIPPGVIVVPHRSGSQSTRLLPPILILMAGAAFLAYRTSRSADWRGVSAWFETDLRVRHAVAKPVEPLARADVAPQEIETATDEAATKVKPEPG